MSKQDRAKLFWANVSKKTSCWEWLRRRDKYGYGKTQGVLRRDDFAHRVAWELTYGPILPGTCVLHTCDNPSCVNPVHLFLGTQLDNVLDRVKKGRSANGERHSQAKLTASKVIEIRKLHNEQLLSYATLSMKYGVSEHAIKKIVLRQRWKHLSLSPPARVRRR
ncbi:MAG: HNH endonuclease [Nitrospinota bacterium]